MAFKLQTALKRLLKQSSAAVSRAAFRNAAPFAAVLAAVAVHSDFEAETDIFSSRFGPHKWFPQKWM
jgi:hypothetical protein